jgi:hypothetical protein
MPWRQVVACDAGDAIARVVRLAGQLIEEGRVG